MDFITHLPKVGDFEAILVIIDHFSKYATFIPTTKQCSAEMTAQLFFKHVVKLWGVPTSIVSDRDGRFIGSFWTELFSFLGTSLNISSSYHPQTNGQTERFNCMLEEYLRHFVNARQKNWVQLLDVAQFCFNAQTSSSIGRSPFEIVSGRQPVLPHLVDHPFAGKNPQALNFTKEWKQTNDIARAYLEKASKRMKKWADKKRRPLEFRAGDQVLIKLRPEQVRFRGRKDQRLIRKYEGPVQVLKKVGNTSYRVVLPTWMKIYPVIHKEDKDVEEILAERVRRGRRPARRIHEYLVKWKNLHVEETSWERVEDLEAWKQKIEDFKLRQLTGIFDMGDGNKEFPPMYSQGIDLSQDDVCASRPSRASEGRTGSSGTKRKRRMLARALANDNHVRTKFFRILHEIPELTSLDRALLQRHLLSRMDDFWGFVLMPEDEREGFCRVLLRDITR
ncbi:reverse transcriptase [Cucumis melo var. makuwa]|nr:reverse transcriptase [Cucumis melo var. makuwa]